MSGYRFVVIPEWILYNADLSAAAVRIYGVLCNKAGTGVGPVYLSLAALGATVGHSARSTRQSVRQLRAVGAISEAPAWGDVNEYYVGSVRDAVEPPIPTRGKRGHQLHLSETHRRYHRLLNAGHVPSCNYCGVPLVCCAMVPADDDDTAVPFTVDHVVPVSRGGGHELSNLVPACRRCNCQKGARPVGDFVGGR